jgi:hypothetical protein
VVPLGLWIGIVGYGILYAGVIKLGGGTCSLGQAFRGQCKPASSSGQAGSNSTTPGAQSGLSTNALPANSPSPGGGSW